MKTITRILLIIAAVLAIGLFGFAEDVSAQTCLHSGCKRKCVSGDRYCSKHQIKSTTKTTKKTGKKKKVTKKSYYKDEMPDCDDYDNWGEFMDDWDGNIPDGSDASDYWDNW